MYSATLIWKYFCVIALNTQLNKASQSERAAKIVFTDDRKHFSKSLRESIVFLARRIIERVCAFFSSFTFIRINVSKRRKKISRHFNGNRRLPRSNHFTSFGKSALSSLLMYN
eukprot:Lithocolla_globosa_v1_NODE_708_length_3409_cov_18.276386.p3 type:complete len:113 gc:universal NODE_708_length_3409_cov_18.276386:2535-2873(+)